jgi:hypothetical protein
MRGGSECAPRVANQAITLECAERHIATRQRTPNEIGLHIEFRIVGRLQEFLGLHDAQGDTARRRWPGRALDQRPYVHSIDVKTGVPLEPRHDPNQQAPRPAPTPDVGPQVIECHGDSSPGTSVEKVVETVVTVVLTEIHILRMMAAL